MSQLLLQITIKQWDKSQRSDTHVNLRAEIPTQHAIIFPPAFYTFDKHCVIDQHGGDLQADRVNYSKQENIIHFDRYLINIDTLQLAYHDPNVDQPAQILGSINNQWLQSHYQCRYSVYESELFYWLYEDVTLNALYSTNDLDEQVFLTTKPVGIYTHQED
jgi:hypothetical protein